MAQTKVLVIADGFIENDTNGLVLKTTNSAVLLELNNSGNREHCYVVASTRHEGDTFNNLSRG